MFSSNNTTEASPFLSAKSSLSIEDTLAQLWKSNISCWAQRARELTPDPCVYLTLL